MSNKNITIAIDDGNANLKLAYMENGTIKGLVEPARAQVATIEDTGFLQEAVRAYYIGDKKAPEFARPYVVRDTQDSMTTGYKEFYTSEFNAVLINNIMYSAGLHGQKVDLLTTLPPNLFTDKTFRNSVSKIKQQLLGQVWTAFEGAKELAVVESVKIMPEALSAWFNLIIDDELKIKEHLITKKVAIVDIGGGTTDICTIQNYEADWANVKSKDIGMISVLEAFKTQMVKNNIPASNLNRGNLEEAIKTGSIRLFGVNHDVSSLARQSYTVISAKLHDFIESSLGTVYDLDKIVLIGGGSIPLKKALQSRETSFTKLIEFSKDPVLANAKGALKYKLMSE